MKVKTRKGRPVTTEEEELKEVEQITFLGPLSVRLVTQTKNIKTRIIKARQAFAMP